MLDDKDEKRQNQFRAVIDTFPGVQLVRFVDRIEYEIIGNLEMKLIGRLRKKGSSNHQIAEWLRPILEEHEVYGDYIFSFEGELWSRPVALVRLSETFEWLEPLIETQIRSFVLYFVRPDNKFYLRVAYHEGYLEAEIVEA